MAVTINNPSWDLILEVADSTPSGEMPTELEQLAWVEDGSFSLDTADGTKKQLIDSQGVTRGVSEGEPTITIGATLIGIPKAMASKFWITETSGDKLKVKGMIRNGVDFALKLSSPLIPNSDTLEVPRSFVKLGLAVSTDKGFMAPISFQILKSQADILFQLGVNKEVKPPVENGE